MRAIEASTCVDAWLQACDYLLSREADDWRAYNIVLEIRNPQSLPANERTILGIVDSFLTAKGKLPINSVVNTIFPASLYQRFGATGLADRYMSDIYPGVKRHPDWKWGTYAQRLFQRIDKKNVDVRPLETLVKKIKTQLSLPATQRAAYELSVLDVTIDLPIYEPELDRNRPLGGPCLSHLSIKLTGDHKLMLTGFYRSHFYIQRALGNFLGLAHLQHFIAAEAGVELGPLICHSSMAQLELESGKWGKKDVTSLLARCRDEYAKAAA